MDKVCLIVLNYNDYQSTINLIEIVKDYNSINNIVIVDNCSTNDSYNRLVSCIGNNIELIRTEKNGGYGYGNNFGARYCIEKYNPSYLLFANPDTVFDNSLISKFTISFRKTDNLALVSSIAKLKNGNKQSPIAWKVPTALQYTLISSMIFSKLLILNKYKPSHYENKNCTFVDCVSGSLIMIKASLFIEIGGYDEGIFLYGEETLIGYKIKKKGFRSLLLLDDYYVHLHDYNHDNYSKGIQRKDTIKSRKYIVKNYLSKNKFSNFICLILFKIFDIEHKLMNLFIRRK